MAKAKEYASESSLEKAAAKVAKQQVRVIFLPSDPAIPTTCACPSIFAPWPGLNRVPHCIQAIAIGQETAS